MGGFCVHEWHQTTEEDLIQMSYGEDYWMYAGADAACGLANLGGGQVTRHIVPKESVNMPSMMRQLGLRKMQGLFSMNCLIRCRGRYGIRPKSISPAN